MIRRLITNLILGVVVSLIGAVIMAAVAFIVYLPNILQTVIWVLRQFLVVSYLVYRQLLVAIRELVKSSIGLDVLEPEIRISLTLLLSEGVCFAAVWFLATEFILWPFVLFAIHGLAVGFFWDQLVRPGEFQLGIPVE